MKNLKLFEEYYDDKGNTYPEESGDWVFEKPGLVYLNPDLESILPELKEIRNKLQDLSDDIEGSGPYDEDILNAVSSIDKVFKKWEDRPLNKTAKKYNI